MSGSDKALSIRFGSVLRRQHHYNSRSDINFSLTRLIFLLRRIMNLWDNFAATARVASAGKADCYADWPTRTQSVSDRSAACRNGRRDVRDLHPLEWPSVAPEGGGFGRCRDHCDGLNGAGSGRPQEKAALLAEVEAEGGKVTVVARRHRISESVLYNWRAAWKAAAAVMQAPVAAPFIPLGVFGGSSHRDTSDAGTAAESRSNRGRSGGDAALARSRSCCRTVPGVSVDAFVNEKALSRVLRAMKGAT